MNIELTMDKIRRYCTFEDGLVYMLIMLPRKKENTNQVEREKLNKRVRYVCSNMDDVEHALVEFNRVATVHSDVVFRVYLSVNRRSLVKGMLEFQKKLMDYQYDLLNGNREVFKSISRLGSEFKSVLAKKVCRADRYFMYDIDITNTTLIGNALSDGFRDEVSKHTEIKHYGKSKNGFVLICNPYNPNLVDLADRDIELKNDAYLYIEVLNV